MGRTPCVRREWSQLFRRLEWHRKEHICRYCKYLVPGEDKNAKRLVTKDKPYKCNAPLPLMVLPDSITRSYGWREPESYRRMVTPDDGKHCPLWQEMN